MVMKARQKARETGKTLSDKHVLHNHNVLTYLLPVTVFGINVGDSDVKLKFSGKKKSIEEYILQAPELTSQ